MTDAKRGFWVQGELTPFAGFQDTGSGVRAAGEARRAKALTNCS